MFLGFAVLVSCTPSNHLFPLRGEDPEAMALSRDRADWLARTGATQAFEALRAAVSRGDAEATLARVGPATRTLLEAHVRDTGEPLERALKRGRVASLSLPGIEDPLAWLRAKGTFKVVEKGDRDPGRRQARVFATPEGRSEGVELAAVFEGDSWRIELVRLMDGNPGLPVPGPGEGR
jgi:hypothetical protein